PDPVPWCPAGLYLPRSLRPGGHFLHAAGAYYVQEASAMAVAEVLAPRPGERVLDLAAAPGGKATHLAQLMEGEGLLVCNDVTPDRARVLAENLERLGFQGAVTSEAPERLAAAWGDYFDRVLLDAPCSGEGMFRKEPEAARQWSPALVESCARRQRDLILDAARLVRPGGHLCYSTCTFAPEEDEAVIEHLLRARADFEVVAVGGFAPGRPHWAGGDARLAASARLWPHRLPGEGHYVALLRRTGGEEAARARPEEPSPPNAATRKLLRDFAGEHAVPAETLTVFRGQLQHLHPETPALRGLKVLRAGPGAAEVKPGRLEPAHALAHSTERWADVPSLDLEPADPRLAAYLRGEALEQPGPAGWTLVRTAGLGLGWGKRTGSTVKNHYPRYLRRNR
ncbi:MAG TPA: RsmB/NOP family class I SAM-dependent RNA methyltransferase, partial [Deinococcales bacterium]|nr:RsmB/NOP family class I SAM-dependent RNA methyltransferase [Deinococcales bacterium]